MLVVRGTKKLRHRLKGAPADEGAESTTALGDWFANALFWRPQVVLLVNERTLLPAFVPLAPATTLLYRVPDAIESVLRLHGVSEEFLAAEREAMRELRVAPTNNRSVVGVMNELAYYGEVRPPSEQLDLDALSVSLSRIIFGPLVHGTPRAELAAVLGSAEPMAEVIAFPPQDAAPRPPERPAETSTSVYQLKVTLEDIRPPIWRRVLVDGASTLNQLHEVIQAAFGWFGYHMHDFEVDRTRYAVPDPDWDLGPPTRDERRTRLGEIAEEGSSFRYTYDFGDNWRHKVTFEKVQPSEAGMTVPALIGGRRACPPEDCGGTWGYRELLDILADPTHPEHDERLEWIGGPFDPDAFDTSDFEARLRDAGITGFDI